MGVDRIGDHDHRKRIALVETKRMLRCFDGLRLAPTSCRFPQATQRRRESFIPALAACSKSVTASLNLASSKERSRLVESSSVLLAARLKGKTGKQHPRQKQCAPQITL